MQVSRDGKMPVAMFDEDAAIMSPAYPMFEVVDENKLLPEYLMMWFCRSEFDREACFYAVGGVRGSLTWEDFCNMKRLVPGIKPQRQIVEQYQTLETRIQNNRKRCTTLEQTAQALYTKTFVEGIDKEHLPEGWRMGKLDDIAIAKNGKLKEITEGIIPIYGGNGVVGYTTENNAENVIVVRRVGANCGNLYMQKNRCWVNDNAISVSTKEFGIQYIYRLMQTLDLNNQSEGSSQPLITKGILNKQECLIPPKEIVNEFCSKAEALYNSVDLYNQENEKILEMQSLLLSKIGK